MAKYPIDPGLAEPAYTKQFLDAALATGDAKIIVMALAAVIRARYTTWKDFSDALGLPTAHSASVMFNPIQRRRVSTERLLAIIQVLGLKLTIGDNDVSSE